jgi:nicotinate phosphoribosyltransferase
MLIRSLLDTDLYKFTMMQVVLHHFPGAQVEYLFKCRTPGVDLASHIDSIRTEISNLCKLRFEEQELAYVRGLRFMKSDFVDFLALFQFNEKYIRVEPRADRSLDITIRGPWLHTILYEIPVLAIVSEVYFRRTQPNPALDEGRRRLREKIELVRTVESADDLKISDFGTRRRFSLTVAGRDHRDAEARDPAVLRRNVERAARDEARGYASRYDGARIHAGVPGARPAPARRAGVRLRQVGAGISRRPRHRALRHLRHERVPARLRHVLLQAVRRRAHDSGDPFEWGEKLIAHYQKNRVDPRTKTLIFSDQLSFPLAIEISRRFAAARRFRSGSARTSPTTSATCRSTS